MSATLVRPADRNCPYGEAIASALAQPFPAPPISSHDSLEERVLMGILANSNIRSSSAPTGAGLQSIRQAIAWAMKQGRPIPVLTPWGSKKTQIGAPLDVAELFALRQLQGLQERVSASYSPGIEVRLRLEDTSGYYLFSGIEGVHRDTERYCSDFELLVRIMEAGFVTCVRESSIIDDATYFAACDEAESVIRAYLDATDIKGLDGAEMLPEWKVLQAIGWKGLIPDVQRSYYRSRYLKLYPGITLAGATRELARYLAGSLRRYQMNATGTSPDWEGHVVRVTFVNPIPGAPEEIAGADVRYRTVPEKMGRTHVMPWRARGYVCVIEDKSIVTPKLTHWGDSIALSPARTTFKRNDESITLPSPYLRK